MNKYLLLTAAALIGTVAPAVANANAGRIYTIHFNSFCDGMTFHRTQAPPIASGEHLNLDCAGGTAPVMGTVKKSEFLLFETASPSTQFAYAIHKPIRNGGEWDLWVCFSGTTCFSGGGGTYGLGCCDARESGVPIKTRVAEIIAQRKSAKR
jgi:hypothetical protein